MLGHRPLVGPQELSHTYSSLSLCCGLSEPACVPVVPRVLVPSAEMLVPPPTLAPQVKALGYDGNSPLSVRSWLVSLGLQDYVPSFLSSGYSSIDTVKNLWELELVNVSTALL